MNKDEENRRGMQYCNERASCTWNRYFLNGACACRVRGIFICNDLGYFIMNPRMLIVSSGFRKKIRTATTFASRSRTEAENPTPRYHNKYDFHSIASDYKILVLRLSFVMFEEFLVEDFLNETHIR